MATSPASIGFSFDAKNKKAQRAAARHGATLVREVSNETKRAIRVVVVQAIRRGVPPLEAARQIRELVGLTERQALAVQHFRENLQNTGMIPSRIDAAVSRFAAKKLRQRAENIARTETMAALNRGTLEAWRQAEDEGVLSDDALKEWIVTPDDRLCQICAPLDGQKRPRDEPFSIGKQSPPAHPQCRCTVGIAFDPNLRKSDLVRRNDKAFDGIDVSTANILADGEREIRANDFETGIAVKNGAVLVKNKGAEKSVSFSKKDIALMADSVLTHNHPGLGGTFSVDDIEFASHANLKEMRVVTKHITYRIRRTGNKWPPRSEIRKAFNERYASGGFTDFIWEFIKRDIGGFEYSFVREPRD